ncbi:MAG: L-threonylcarbamoyladenylate synthase [Candidatus Hatepunaea meridiana]|nr:L-threonylcarbamoyladenylate synthase [Candidatus Hatepunaea meridiana]
MNIEKLINILNSNRLIIIATDTVYGLIGKAFQDDVFNRLNRIKEGRKLPYEVIFQSLDQLEKWNGRLDPFRRRVTDALLPGPVTLILNSSYNIPEGYLHKELGLAVRVSSNSLAQQLCNNVRTPLWATSANRTGEPAPSDFSKIDKELVSEIDAVIDNGKTKYSQSSTVIDLRKFPYAIIRKGPKLELVEKVLNKINAPLEVLVVCTGNICRSPLGEVILTDLLGDPDKSGVNVSSAGTHAVDGYPATYEMVAIAADWGIDHSKHRARQITYNILHKSDIILVAEPYHRDLIIQYAPDVKDRIRLFAEPVGLDSIPDPIGSSVETYSDNADLIRNACIVWQSKLKRIIDGSGWHPA